MTYRNHMTEARRPVVIVIEKYGFEIYVDIASPGNYRALEKE